MYIYYVSLILSFMICMCLYVYTIRLLALNNTHNTHPTHTGFGIRVRSPPAVPEHPPPRAREPTASCVEYSPETAAPEDYLRYVIYVSMCVYMYV